MSTRKITELTNVTSAQDSDLLIIETSSGTKSIAKKDLTKVKIDTISLLASNWDNESNSQAVTIENTTENSKIDLQPDSTALNQLINDGVSALYIENVNGIFTAYAIGATPTINLSIQVTITEVG